MTLTDYGLTALCAWFGYKLWVLPSNSPILKKTWIWFFTSIAVAALAGGTVHGFFLDKSTLGHRILWPMSLLGIGLTASSAWVLSGYLASQLQHLKKWIWFSGCVFIVYAALVLLYSQDFSVVIFNYLPAMLALLILSLRNYIQVRSRFARLISIGLVISFLAAYVQQAGIYFHPTYFNHNSTYHLIQAIGLIVLYLGAQDQIQFERNKA